MLSRFVQLRVGILDVRRPMLVEPFKQLVESLIEGEEIIVAEDVLGRIVHALLELALDS